MGFTKITQLYVVTSLTVMCALRAQSAMILDPDMCILVSHTSREGTHFAGGHAATKHQLEKTSGSLYGVQGDCAT